jgi:hypothetical protein
MHAIAISLTLSLFLKQNRPKEEKPAYHPSQLSLALYLSSLSPFSLSLSVGHIGEGEPKANLL